MTQLRLRDFRNYARLDAEFQPGFHLFLGNNAQGKTNLLEAIYLAATLRSFRGAASAQLVRHGQTGYFVGAGIHSDAAHKARIYWSAAERQLNLDGRPIRKLSEYLGVFRAVVFSAEDLQLIKGPAGRRRRYLDLLLTQTHPAYLTLWQRYIQALRSRNALLKQPRADEATLEGFSRELIETGSQLIQYRRDLLPQVAPLASQAYGRLAGGDEPLELHYRPSIKSDFAVELAQSRARERALRTTVLGPHRDDLALLIQGRPAEDFGSEGQKRSAAIALKMAQAEYLTSLRGAPPVLLIDDIMGELDAHRRSAFLPLLERVDRAGSQVFMTATEESWPTELGRNLHRWQVEGGTVAPRRTGSSPSLPSPEQGS